MYESVLLTPEGEDRAMEVSGKFAILMQFLSEVLGVEAESAFVDACLMEHYVGGGTMGRLVDLLRFFEDEEYRAALEAFRDYRRSCEGEKSCPSCSFHCDLVIPSPDTECN